MAFDSNTLTPTQDLVMEVLAARFRLGETMWTFDSRTRSAADGLVELGMVSVFHGIVEKTYRAALTEKGRDAYLTDGYVPRVALLTDEACAKIEFEVLTSAADEVDAIQKVACTPVGELSRDQQEGFSNHPLGGDFPGESRDTVISWLRALSRAVERGFW